MDGLPNFGTGQTSCARPATWFDLDDWDEADIPARPWLAIGYMLRGAVTTVIGAGGVSKSSLMLGYAAAGALGVDYHGFKPLGAYRSVVYNVEDDQAEQRRRLTAVATSFGKLPRDLARLIARTGPSEVGTLFERCPDTGVVMQTAAMNELEKLLVAHRADILFVDPLAELHAEEENDNTAMRAIVAAFRALAVKLKIAVVIIHHTRKGAATPGDAEAGRGASAISGASRVVLTVTGMTQDEEKAFGLPTDTRKHYFRVDGGKANYSSLTDCEWFERVVFTLQPSGDQVAVPRPWHPPIDAVTPEAQGRVEEAVRRGSPQGPWSPQLGSTPRSVKNALVEAGITTKPGQQAMLAAIFKAGFVTLRYRDPFRKFVNGIRSPDGQPSNVDWEDDIGAAE